MTVECTCNCHKADAISFFWMNDNFTFTQIKGKNLKQILAHINRIRKKSTYGMLCEPCLLKNGKDFRRIGKSVHDDECFEENLQKWIEDIEKNEMAMELISKGFIDND